MLTIALEKILYSVWPSNCPTPPGQPSHPGPIMSNLQTSQTCSLPINSKLLRASNGLCTVVQHCTPFNILHIPSMSEPIHPLIL